MELSESDSNSVPITSKDSELGFKSANSSPALSPCSNPDQSSDLDYVADSHGSLPSELQSRLELKENADGLEKEGGGEEAEDDLKVLNLNGGFEEEPQEKLEGGIVCGGDDCVRGDNVYDYEDSGWNDDVGWNANERKIDGLEKEGGGGEAEKELKVSNLNVGFGEDTQEKVEGGIIYGGDDSGGGDYVYDYEDSGWNDVVSWNGNERRIGEFGDDGIVGGMDVDKKYERSDSGRKYQYPVRPEAEDCAFYMKTGTCKFGSNCKFNHPVRRKNQGKVRGKEESTERSNTPECKYHLSSGGCKFGKACRYNHTGIKSSPAPALELNFLGLPIRLGEKECPYYMRNGSCKYGANCKFNHPDPTAVGGDDSPAYSNGGCLPLQGITQASVATWPSPVTLTETPPFVLVMPSTNQGVSPQNPEWNGYQQPIYVPERNRGPPVPYVMNSPTIEPDAYGHLQQQMHVGEFPERPGEPDCSYFMKTGNCKFKSNCKFHHPKSRVARLPPCTLSDKGLPLRPDQNVCAHYSRYGICKFGPACKFDHPINQAPAMPGLDRQSSYANSTTSEGAGITRTSSGNDALVQQTL